MGEARSPWRALRPVLLAGAATLTWLTFSSTSASADTLPDSSSLLGGVTSSVTSVTENVVSAVPASPAAAPAAEPAPGLLQPVVSQVAGAADDLAVSVPVVNQVVPAGTVSTISTPVVQIADGATQAVAETVVQPVVETVPVLEPVLEPVSDFVAGPAPLPAQVPQLPQPAAAEEPPAPAAAAAPESILAETEGVAPVEQPAVDVSDDQGTAAAGNPAGTLALVSVVPAVSPASISAEQPDQTDTSPHPAQAPAVPGSGTGSGGSAGGVSAPAAWLSSLDLRLPLVGNVLVNGDPEHAPSPVSFDPGSSPD